MRFLITLIILFFISNPFVFGQVTSSTSSNETVTQQGRDGEAQVNLVIEKSGAAFKQGLAALKDNLRLYAGEQFNKSVEVFLMSTLNVQRSPKLQGCYSQLVETIYRIEFPSDKQAPNIRSLSSTCGWNITNETADLIAKLVLSSPNTDKDKISKSLITSIPNPDSTGFNEQKFESSPLDELAKLELTQEETEEKETWQTISKRTGISVQDLMAANGGVQTPGKNVVLPQTKDVKNITYSRPMSPIKQETNNIRVVKAQAGDTVKSLAERNGASAIDVAKFNGLLPNSKLPVGREIKIPVAAVQNYPLKQTVSDDEKFLGAKPVQQKDGKVSAVMNYFNEALNDPYSLRFVRWSKVEKVYYQGKPFWSVQVKFRAKNAFGAYVLTEQIYYIQKNKVITSQRLY